MGEINEKQHLVAWLDLLGFSAKLESTPLPELVAWLQDVIATVQKSTVSPRQRILARPGEPDRVGPCKIEVFQDTIILWTPEVSALWFRDLFASCQSLLRNLEDRGAPVRGAISCGTLFTSLRTPGMDKTPMILGTAVKRAHEWEAVIDMAGIVIDPRLLAEHPEVRRVAEGATHMGEVFEYPVPTKNGKRTMLTIPWTFEGEAAVVQQLWPVPPGPHAAAAAAIMENTREYLRQWHAYRAAKAEREREQEEAEEAPA